MSREKHQRNLDIIKMRQSGLSFTDIGVKLNISKQMVRETYLRMMKKIK